MSIPKMLTIKEAASESGLSYCYLRNLCLSGAVYCVRSGVKWLINSDSLSAYLSGSEPQEGD